MPADGYCGMEDPFTDVPPRLVELQVREETGGAGGYVGDRRGALSGQGKPGDASRDGGFPGKGLPGDVGKEGRARNSSASFLPLPIVVQASEEKVVNTAIYSLLPCKFQWL